jgi:hypothetical protein
MGGSLPPEWRRVGWRLISLIWFGRRARENGVDGIFCEFTGAMGCLSLTGFF